MTSMPGLLLGVTDPVLEHGLDTTVVLIIIGKTIAVFVLLLVSVLMYIWFLRKVIAKMQNRIGPDRAGPFGLFQSTADGIKLFFKEQSEPNTADRRIFRIAPYLAVLPAFLAFSIVPIGGVVTIAGHRTFLQLADLPFGILWLLAMSGLGLYGVLLAGWSSGSKYPLLGSVRASAQLLSYEAAFGLAIVGVLVQSNTLSTARHRDPAGLGRLQVDLQRRLVLAPGDRRAGDLRDRRGSGTNHPPFDLVEAEQELTGGFFTEYTGIKFASLLPGRIHERDHDVRHHGHAVLRRPLWPRARLPARQRLVQRVDHAGVLVPVQGDPAPLRHGVAAGVVSTAALRPAHVAGLEGPHGGSRSSG